jgi:8-oxo-dGTP pyrophosphatase MutT (NUDIX family)
MTERRRRPPPVEGRPRGEGIAAPRPAASLLLLRGGAEALEVLLMRRNPEARFMGGFWVFPGGAVDPADGVLEEDAHKAAAVRELAEEAGIEGLDPGSLVPYSRWITPERAAVRFDTRFYLAEAPDDAQPRADGAEMVDAGWFAPQTAIDAYDRDELPLVFPTLKHLEQIAPFHSAAELLDHARGRTVEPVLPKIVGSGEEARIVLPGEPEYRAT